MSDVFSVLVVDDEPLARLRLKRMLSGFEEVEVVAEAESISETCVHLEQNNIDVVFLDVQMPGGSGFQLFEKTKVSAKVIFVTAYEQYAIRAFEVNALDYLLKPIRQERLAHSIERLHKTLPESHRASNYSLQSHDRIHLSTPDVTYFPYISDIVYIEANGDYTEVYLKNGNSAFVKVKMSDWEERLCTLGFCRIHRKYLINAIQIQKLQKDNKRQTHMVLSGGLVLPISRRRLATVKTVLQKQLDDTTFS